MREKVKSIFGEGAFSHGMFYVYEGALRLELSVSGSPVDMFTCAWKKADEVCRYLFAKDKPIGVCLSFYGKESLLSTLSFFRSLDDCCVKIPKDSECWREPDPEDDGFYRHYILFLAPYGALNTLLWGALAQDLGIRPRICGDVYLFDLDEAVLVHPYDDRGMDIISPDTSRLGEVYRKYNDYLLDYNREIMDKFYGPL